MANPVKIPATVQDIAQHGPGVFAITMKSARRPPRFRPGQFLHLTIDPFDPQGGYWPESRVFSIASAPTSDAIVVVYSVKGRYTAKMQSELAVGKEIWLKFPYGDFTIESESTKGRDIVLIAGGTGISPYMSFLQSEEFAAQDRAIRLIYGIRQPEHLLFSGMLTSCTKKSGFGVNLFVEESATEALVENARQLKGMITIDHIRQTAQGLNTPVYLLSGPPAMIRTFRTGLVETGVAAEDVRIDDWE